MKKTVQKAYAKINLYLDVVGKRDDGYHNINSVMQTVSLSDTVTIETIESGEIILADNTGVEKEKNLCFKAAMLFFEELKKIRTEKGI